MELVMPGIGVLFWTCLIFLLLFLLLKKWAFPVINGMLRKREEKISSALEEAEAARKEMAELKSRNSEMLDQAKAERERILAQAKEHRRQIEESSRQKAKEEYDRILQSAKADIEREKQAALEDLRVSVANLALDMAEKVIGNELSDRGNQKELVEKGLKELDAGSMRK